MTRASRTGVGAAILALACGLPSSGSATVQDNPPTEKDLKALLEPLRRKHDLPALAAAVVSGRGAVAVGAVGVRRRGKDTPVTAEDRFHLGSDTKAMTAALIGSLVETGELSWDTTLEKAFPQLVAMMVPELRKVTLAELLTHRSGLPANLPGGWWTVPRKGTPRQQRLVVVAKAVSDGPEVKPGTKFLYSNLGYVVAAAMAEEAANATWEQLMEKRIFGPLGMTTAGHGPPARGAKVLQPFAHQSSGKPVPSATKSDNPPVMGPAGRVHCSLGDWARFIADQIRGNRGERALLKPATYKKLHSVHFKGDFYTLGGWGSRTDDPRAGGLLLAHDGSNTLNYATAWVAPGRDFAVLVATNQGGDAASTACHEARDLLLMRYLKRE
ncbi:MAG: beta-lactamase family protein [Gemmataceae bacterium]|nr:beta-lactamase family protein [Gemmataceae bacterium]